MQHKHIWIISGLIFALVGCGPGGEKDQYKDLDVPKPASTQKSDTEK